MNGLTEIILVKFKYIKTSFLIKGVYNKNIELLYMIILTPKILWRIIQTTT